MPHPLAGTPAPHNLLVDLPKLLDAFRTRHPNPAVPAERVAFGTSGHRGTSLNGTFTAGHIRAITAAIVEYRTREKIDGPLFVGRDTHALSQPAEQVALDVIGDAAIPCRVAAGGGSTPTPVISHAILRYNREHPGHRADGIVITPSHNPPEDGGFKYNPPHGGPADTGVTKWIEARANELLESGMKSPDAIRGGEARGRKNGSIRDHDFVTSYVEELSRVIDVECIASSGLRIGVDPLGGASLRFMEAIADRLKLPLEITNHSEDPQFAFMPLDHDGKIRMDCSSPFAMANLLALQNRFDLAVAMDPDADRHGIVSPSRGLLNPNHYLALAINFLFQHRPHWPSGCGVGKTLVSSSLIDRVAAKLGRTVYEVPVGFKYFVAGLFDGTLGFGGEESAGASFLRFDGTPWSTDKDGLILSLLAAEMTAVIGREPGELLSELGTLPAYRRIDRPISPAEKQGFQALTADQFRGQRVGNDPVNTAITRAPGNNEPIGGIKVMTDRAWFAARPSGTENIYKLYAESLTGEERHLDTVIADAERLLRTALTSPA